ncbi:MAG: hypothetical protein Q9162_005009 [Coniocarpon cinnabarinum]
MSDRTRPRISSPLASSSAPITPSFGRDDRAAPPSPTSLSPRATVLSQPTGPDPEQHDFAHMPLTADAEKQTKVFERQLPQLADMGSSYSWWRFKRLATRPLPWAIVIVVGLITWWSAGASTEFDSEDVQLRLRELFPPEFTRELQFFPASNRKIHVSLKGPAPRVKVAQLRVYFDLNVTNTSTVVVSLQNQKTQNKPTELPLEKHAELEERDVPQPGQQYSQYTFSAASRLRVSAPPVSLLALVDNEEYVVLPNATSLVPVRMKDLNKKGYHTIRVIAPMTDDAGMGVVQLDGIWLDKGGQLVPVEGSTASVGQSIEDDFDAESDEIGRSHRLGLASFMRGSEKGQTQAGDDEDEEETPDFRRRKKLIEIVTDTPAHLDNRPRHTSRTREADNLLSGVVGWEYLIGEMFSIDHVSIGAEGMCLVHDCVGGTGTPSGMGDTFFRSGPAGSPHFSHPWPFQNYVPDAMILNLGASDHYSFELNAEDYNKTSTELYRSFEDTYVSLVKAIRTLAYPNHPSVLEMERLGIDTHEDNDAPASIPIFIMRPFNGEHEHATQGAVNRIRADGDKMVFWLDTTGWLDTEYTDTTESDFFTDPDEPMGHPHLTERGNQKVAIFLHMHLCRYLAHADDKCAFLPPEVYQGNVFDPTVATFDRYVESEKERQMKEIYWADDGSDFPDL